MRTDTKASAHLTCETIWSPLKWKALIGPEPCLQKNTISQVYLNLLTLWIICMLLSASGHPSCTCVWGMKSSQSWRTKRQSGRLLSKLGIFPMKCRRNGKLKFIGGQTVNCNDSQFLEAYRTGDGVRLDLNLQREKRIIQMGLADLCKNQWFNAANQCADIMQYGNYWLMWNKPIYLFLTDLNK